MPPVNCERNSDNAPAEKVQKSSNIRKRLRGKAYNLISPKPASSCDQTDQPSETRSGVFTADGETSGNGWKELLGFDGEDVKSWSSLVTLLNKRVDGSSLAFLRIAFGSLMLVDTLEERGWSSAEYRWGDVDECRFPLFSALSPLPPHWMHLLYLTMFCAAAGLMLGVYYRLCCALYALSYWYVLLLDKTVWNNHSYLFGLLALLFLVTDAHRVWSLDGLRRRRRIANGPTTVPMWNYALFRAQIFIVFFVAGIKKLHPDWVTGYSMHQLSAHWVFDPFRLALSNVQIDLLVVHTGGLALDLSMGFLLYLEGTRPLGLIFGSFFHIMNSLIFSIGMFPYAMLAVQLIFCRPDWPRRLPSTLRAFFRPWSLEGTGPAGSVGLVGPLNTVRSEPGAILKGGCQLMADVMCHRDAVSPADLKKKDQFHLYGEGTTDVVENENLILKGTNYTACVHDKRETDPDGLENGDLTRSKNRDLAGENAYNVTEDKRNLAGETEKKKNIIDDVNNQKMVGENKQAQAKAKNLNLAVGNKHHANGEHNLNLTSENKQNLAGGNDNNAHSKNNPNLALGNKESLAVENKHIANAKNNRTLTDENKQNLDDENKQHPTRGQHLATAATLLYIALQALLPFSHPLTPGYNGWTQGLYGYSWDMMVNSWDLQHVRLEYVDRATGERGFLRPEAWTHAGTRWAMHADTTHQYATCVALRLAAESHAMDAGVEIHVDVWMSLNERFQQRMFDPGVDIVSAHWSPFRPTPWVLPLLANLSAWRERLEEMEEVRTGSSNATGVVFMADFPGMMLENYIQPDLEDTEFEVLKGKVVVQLARDDETLNYTLQEGDTMKLPSEVLHYIHTVSETPSCFMFTFVNATRRRLDDEGHVYSELLRMRRLGANDSLFSDTEESVSDPDTQRIWREREARRLLAELLSNSTAAERLRDWMMEKYSVLKRTFLRTAQALLRILHEATTAADSIAARASEL